jgi:hypothetical protein
MISVLPDLFLTVEQGQSTYYGNWIRQVALQPFFAGDTGGMPRFWEGENDLNQSLRALVYRITLGLDVQRHFNSILYATYCLCLLYMLWVFSCSVELRNHVALDGSLVIIGMLLFSPMSSKSHFVALILPFMVVTAHMLSIPPLRNTLAFASVLSCVLNNLTSRDLVGRAIAQIAGHAGSVTLGTITLAVAIGYIVNVNRKSRPLTREPAMRPYKGQAAVPTTHGSIT